MATNTNATVDDLYHEPGKAELVDGELQRMSPAGFQHNRAAGAIYISLRQYEQHAEGRAMGDNAGFLCNLAHRQSFSPDAAFYTGEPSGMKFMPSAPAFAVEVRSEGDYGPAAEKELAAKRDDYFAAGTLVVWDVDLVGENVVGVYRASDPETPSFYHRGELAEAEPAVPGWLMPVDELFE